jgi:hypothetical protein
MFYQLALRIHTEAHRFHCASSGADVARATGFNQNETQAFKDREIRSG